MNSRIVSSTTTLIGLLALLIFATSCTVKTSSRDRESGDKASESKGAEISTPFGTLRARNEDDGKATGLAVYPGARLLKDKDNDHGGNVVIDTPVFGLKVVAVKYETDDPPEKVLDFYRNELKQYGRKVLECRPNHEADDVVVGDVHKNKSDNDLTCDKDDKKSGPVTELKAGTEDNQRVVGIEQKGKSTQFALVHVRVRGGNDNTM
jgi:hypothetical protein